MDKHRRVSAYINGVPLTDAVPLALIRQITENPAEHELLTGERPARPGQNVIVLRRTRLNVTIEFVIRELFDLSARAMEIEAAAAWAQDGILELSNKPGRKLKMVVTERPALGNIRDYNQAFLVKCSAIACPYWQDAFYISASTTGTTGNAVLLPAGTVKRLPLEFTVIPTGETMTALTVAANGSAMEFTGLNVAAGTPFCLRYDDNMLQWITAGGASALSARTAASADDLFVYPRQSNTITFTANTAVSAVFMARGLYL